MKKTIFFTLSFFFIFCASAGELFVDHGNMEQSGRAMDLPVEFWDELPVLLTYGQLAKAIDPVERTEFKRLYMRLKSRGHTEKYLEELRKAALGFDDEKKDN